MAIKLNLEAINEINNNEIEIENSEQIFYFFPKNYSLIVPEISIIFNISSKTYSSVCKMQLIYDI